MRLRRGRGGEAAAEARDGRAAGADRPAVLGRRLRGRGGAVGRRELAARCALLGEGARARHHDE